jgi:hypothetical protein
MVDRDKFGSLRKWPRPKCHRHASVLGSRKLLQKVKSGLYYHSSPSHSIFESQTDLDVGGRAGNIFSCIEDYFCTSSNPHDDLKNSFQVLYDASGFGVMKFSCNMAKLLLVIESCTVRNTYSATDRKHLAIV